MKTVSGGPARNLNTVRLENLINVFVSRIGMVYSVISEKSNTIS